MHVLGNILWHIPFLGFLTALAAFLSGLLLTITVIWAPVGLGLMEYGKFLLAPFSRAMVRKSDLNVQQNRIWKTYSTIVMVLYFPLGLLLCLMAIVQIVSSALTILGIPVALVIAKSLGTYLNPVNKQCVPRAVRDELERRRAQESVERTLAPRPEPHRPVEVAPPARTAAPSAPASGRVGGSHAWLVWVILGVMAFAGGALALHLFLGKRSASPVVEVPEAPLPERPSVAAPTVLFPRHLRASSVSPSKKSEYVAAAAVDGNPETWWQEGAAGDGIGEWLEIGWDQMAEVREIRLISGYQKTRDDRFGDRWFLNNRLRQLRVEVPGNPPFEAFLADRKGFQSVPVPAGLRGTSARLVILDVYPGYNAAGNRVQDSGIAEVEILGVR